MRTLLIMVLGLTMSACTNTGTTRTTISVLEDVTESNFLTCPSHELLVPKLGLQSDMWASARFRYSTITGINYNHRKELFIEKQMALLGNELERKKKVTDFLSEMKTVLTKDKTTNPYKHSSIWEPLIKELIVLQKDTSFTTELYVFSDLQENALWFSVYKKSDLKTLKMTPKKIVDLFLYKASAITKGTKHLKVIVVYQPKDIQEDMAFKHMVNLYTTLFEHLQISIEFTANI